MLKSLPFLAMLIATALAQPVHSPPLLSAKRPIGTPVSLGTKTQSGNNTSIAISPTLQAISSGDFVMTCNTVESSSPPTQTGVSDGTNTYIHPGASAVVWYRDGAVGVASGATITTTYSGGAGSPSAQAMGAWKVSGIISSSSLDTTNNSSNTSVATGVLSQKNEIVTGCSQSIGNNSLAYSGAAGFTTVIAPIGFDGINTKAGIALDIQVVSSTASVTYNPIWSNQSSYNSRVSTFKGF